MSLQPTAKKEKASRKKKGITAALVVAAVIALLEAYPHIKQAITTGDTDGLAEHTKRKLSEMQDAGMFE